MGSTATLATLRTQCTGRKQKLGFYRQAYETNQKPTPPRDEQGTTDLMSG